MTENQPSSPQLVRDLMTVGVDTCPSDTLVPDLARMMLEQDIETVVVMEEGNAIGVVGREQLVQSYSRDDFAQLTAENIMREGVPQAPPDIPLRTAAQLMLDQGIRALFLMHHAAGVEYPAAVLTFQHLLRHMVAHSPEELRDLGIKAERQSPLEVFLQRRDAARRAAKK